MKKIIALTVALTVIISILNISVFAETSTGGIENGGGGTGGNRGMTHQEYKTAMAYLIDDYANGKITVQEFSDRELAVTNEYLEYHKGIGENSYALAVTMGNHMNGIVQKVNTSVQQWGEEARDKVSEWWNGVTSNVPTETTQTSTSNLYGNGAFVKQSRNGLFDEYQCYAYGADYLVIDTSRGLDDVRICYYMNDNRNYTGYLFYDGSYHWNSSFTSGGFQTGYKLVGNTLIDEYGTTYKLYGDVRYIDGTPAPTDDEFEYGTIKKFDKMPAPNLDDLLEDFQTELENENPDLDSIENILKAIYYKLKHQDDNSITPEDLDSLINSAINRLIEEQNKKNCDCSKILALLQEMKLCENVQDIRDKLFEIFPECDFEAEASRIEELKVLLLAKFSFIYNMKTFVTYCFNAYSNTSENPEIIVTYGGQSNKIDFSIFNEHMPLIRWILAAFIYITYAYHTYRKIPSYINGGDNE